MNVSNQKLNEIKKNVAAMPIGKSFGIESVYGDKWSMLSDGEHIKLGKEFAESVKNGEFGDVHRKDTNDDRGVYIRS